jgi:SAM-dependent methyltransferase
MEKNMLQFEKNAAQYAKVRKKITYPESLYQKLGSLCQQHKKALDIGCGNGVSTIRLQPYFKSVEGIDIGEKLIQYAREAYPFIHFEVTSAEKFKAKQSYDLITSATSFYWMDRALMAEKMSALLAPDGIFCAYKYDFPVIYGKLSDFISYELATKWAKYRDQRLVNYDDTLEILDNSHVFDATERFVISNIIDLSAEEVAHFFLSTSYVTKYIEDTDDNNYYDWFIKECLILESSQLVKVNFDIYAYYGKKK